jgi:hypothetical protein
MRGVIVTMLPTKGPDSYGYGAYGYGGYGSDVATQVSLNTTGIPIQEEHGSSR